MAATSSANFEKWFKECKLEFKGTEYFQRTDTDFNVQITKLRGAQPDGIYVVSSTTAQGATIYRQIKQLGYRGTVIASGGNINPKLIELSGAAIEGVFSVSPYVEDVSNPVAAAWRAEYAKQFKNETSFVASLGAVGIELIAQAMDKAGTSTDYNKIAETIRAGKWSTTLGEINFDKIGQGFIASYIVQVKNGKIVTHSKAN